MMRLAYLMIAIGLGLSLMTRGLPTSVAPNAPRRAELIAASPNTPAEKAAASVGETRIDRDGSGQFRLDATVNGQQMPFLVDTGADKVALTIDSARSLGLYVDPSSFEPVAMGAGGAVRGQRVTLDRLEVGGHALSGVDALVLDGLGTNLLGQSALAQLGGVELRGNEMVVR